MWSKITKYGISVQIHRVEILQSWTATRTTHCDGGYDVTIATYLLADLYLPKMKNALFGAPETNRLSCACAARFSYLLTTTEWTIRAKNTSWRRKTLILPFEWRGPGTHCVAMKMSQWTYHYCDNSNNCTKFQFYAEKVFRDIPFFVILNHFMSTVWRYKSSNLHKSKSCITRQPRVLSE